jgi:ABC transporter DrrB family efflux protein
MTVAATAPRRPFGRAAIDIGVITKRNLLRGVRTPDVLVVSVITPVVFVLLFTYVFGGAIENTIPRAAAGKYINWLLPGLLAQFALFGGGQTAVGLVDDLSNGVIDRFRSLPMARSAVLAGRTISDVIRSAIILVVIVGIGALVGFRWQTSILGILSALAVALAFGFAWSWVMAVVGLMVRSQEAVQAAVFIGIFPLAFTSSVFVPTETMPGWLRVFADHQPVTAVTNALRGLILGEGALPAGQTTAGQTLLALVWAVGLTVVFGPIAVRMYRHSLS